MSAEFPHVPPAQSASVLTPYITEAQSSEPEVSNSTVPSTWSPCLNFVDVLLSLGCCHKITPTGGSRRQELVSHSSGGWKSEARVLACLCLGEVPPLVPTLMTSCVLTWQRAERGRRLPVQYHRLILSFLFPFFVTSPSSSEKPSSYCLKYIYLFLFRSRIHIT